MARIFIFLLASCLVAGADFVVTVSGIEGAKGEIRLAIYHQADPFPDQPRRAFKKFSMAATKAKEGKVVFKIPDLGKGTFAFVALHDEDSDGKVRKNFLGIPKEGVAVSNYPKLKPPKFKVAAIENPKGPLVLKLTY